MRLRNPWGTFIWLGEWSWAWPGWTRERRAAAGAAEHWQKPGTFWLPFHRFAQYFDSVDIAQIRAGGPAASSHSQPPNGGCWTDVRYAINVGWNENDDSASSSSSASSSKRNV